MAIIATKYVAIASGLMITIDGKLKINCNRRDLLEKTAGVALRIAV